MVEKMPQCVKGSAPIPLFLLLFVACGPDQRSDPKVEAPTSMTEGVQSFEDFKADLRRVGDGFIVEWDLLIRDEDALRMYHESSLLPQAYRNAESEPLVVATTSSGADDLWAVDERTNLKFCVSAYFADYGPNMWDGVFAAAYDAAEKWRNASGVNLWIASPSCEAGGSIGAAFEIVPMFLLPGASGLLGLAFFPSDHSRSLYLDPVLSQATAESNYSIHDVLLHELGHVLGLRHEMAHTARTLASSVPSHCHESSADARNVTAFDADSVMGYPHCFGHVALLSDLSPVDIAGIRRVYGATAPAGTATPGPSTPGVSGGGTKFLDPWGREIERPEAAGHWSAPTEKSSRILTPGGALYSPRHVVSLRPYDDDLEQVVCDEEANYCFGTSALQGRRRLRARNPFHWSSEPGCYQAMLYTHGRVSRDRDAYVSFVRDATEIGASEGLVSRRTGQLDWGWLPVSSFVQLNRPPKVELAEVLLGWGSDRRLIGGLAFKKVGESCFGATYRRESDPPCRYRWYAGDFDGDGLDDLMRDDDYPCNRSGFGYGGAHVYESTGSSFDAQGELTPSGHGGFGWIIGDFNGDTCDDLMRQVTKWGGGEVALSTCHGTLTPATNWTGAGHRGLGWLVGDFNGDRCDDLLRHMNKWGGAEILLSDCDGGFESPAVWTGASHGGFGWTLGDFDGDGCTDLSAQGNEWGGANVALSTCSGSFENATTWTHAGHRGFGWHVGDFDGDGRQDIFRLGNRWGGAEVLLSDGQGFGNAESWTPAGDGSDGWLIGDFNGDGRADVARTDDVFNRLEALLSTGRYF